ncbi:hypothetical protein Q2E61_09155 [Microbulbifer thermotolerans]|uniref:hypothetical protein n=1 Tax=Microbulbifer thermotolerans TaxID=252514 RepID=UPI0026711DE8|nr:hypothetical protein [Microbulbifer thermotolerans]WKT59094.1 hypothetical protein Q2E61_09155 [Microbulbifer thermotolerans]
MRFAARSTKDTAFGQAIRLAYFEARLFLDGEFHTPKLRQFGISRQVASSDINYYLRTYGPVANYCPRRQRFILDRRYKPRLLDRRHHAAFAMHVENIYALAVKRSRTNA